MHSTLTRRTTEIHQAESNMHQMIIVLCRLQSSSRGEIYPFWRWKPPSFFGIPTLSYKISSMNSLFSPTRKQGAKGDGTCLRTTQIL